MRKTLLLEAQIREKSGKHYAKKVRQQGRIPAVIYGHKQEPMAVSVNEHDLVEGLHHGHRLFDIQTDGKKETVMVKDVQYDHVGKKIIHVDLIRVDVTQTVEVSIPIELKGKPAGAADGGVLTQNTASIEVECVVTEIPEKIVVSVKEMKVDDVIHAGQVQLPAGMKLISDPEMIIASCSIVVEAPTAEEAELEAPTAPEVITERKPEEEEAEPEGKEKKSEKKAEKKPE